jgi:hypothetical protein
MLDDLELPLVQEVMTLEKRVLAEHKPPGMAGSLLQNLGRRLTRLSLWGVASGPGAQSFIEKLNDKFRDAKPLPFTADIVAEAKLEQVLIEDLRVQELAGKPERFAYVLILSEFIKPVEPEDTTALDISILDDAQNLINDLVPGLDFGLDFLTGLERFVSPLTDLLSKLQEFNSSVSRARSG